MWILFNNINIQDILIKTLSENNILLENRFIGSIIDYFIYPSYNIDDVLFKLHNIISNPTIIPYWSLGFHQSRWAYKNINELSDIYNKFIEFKFPIETFRVILKFQMNKNFYRISQIIPLNYLYSLMIFKKLTINFFLLLILHFYKIKNTNIILRVMKKMLLFYLIILMMKWL